MRFIDRYPIIVTPKLRECRAFWTALDEFQRRGGQVALELTDEPFGQRRFGFSDPSGLWVDVVEQIEPAEGFWERYMNAAGS